ncbi:hypothetical protein SOVF_017430 [Spinacia oleracea]|nr:hypothetical protein SOVF_017430 [Spinacia oleracea]
MFTKYISISRLSSSSSPVTTLLPQTFSHFPDALSFSFPSPIWFLCSFPSLVLWVRNSTFTAHTARLAAPTTVPHRRVAATIPPPPRRRCCSPTTEFVLFLPPPKHTSVAPPYRL